MAAEGSDQDDRPEVLMALTENRHGVEVVAGKVHDRRVTVQLSPSGVDRTS